ncbi:hypothetical protein Tco_0281734 [Tanacetum coccineum]
MDNPNLTKEEYIRLEEEKARKRRKVFNWQTATYGKIRVDDNLHDLSYVEAEFPAIVINDDFATQDTLQYKSQVSTFVNDEIDFRISFDESDEEDYTIICDTNSFSYKMISVNNLKTDSENDYEKVMPSIPSPEPAISCFDDLDFFNDFENEFLAIVYNDAQKSKSDLLTEPILNPQHIDEFDLNDKTSLSEYDEEEQNVLYFNDLFPFNIICPDDLESEKDNDNNDIDIIQPFENNENTHGSTTLFETSHDKITKCLNFYTLVLCSIDFADMAPLPPHEQRHKFLRYKGLLMEHLDEASVSVFTNRAWRRMFDIRGPLVHELILKFFSTFRFKHAILDLDTCWTLQFQLGRVRRRMSWWEFIIALGLHTEEEMQTAGFEVYWAGSARQIPDKGDLRDYRMGISSVGDFLGTTPSYTLIRDPILRLCHRLITCSIAGRSQTPEKVTVTDLFYLRGLNIGSINVPYLLVRYLRLTVIAPELPVIDMAELVRLQIYVEIDDTWTWVAMGLERQPDAEAEDAPIIDEGGQADPAPVQAPQQPPLPSPARIPRGEILYMDDDVYDAADGG